MMCTKRQISITCTNEIFRYSQGAEVSVKELDSLLSLLGEKKRKAKQEELRGTFACVSVSVFLHSVFTFSFLLCMWTGGSVNFSQA